MRITAEAKRKKEIKVRKKTLTEEQKKMTLGEWAWKYHPELFQYSKAYVKLSSSTPSPGAPGAGGASTAEEEDEEEEEEDEESIVGDEEERDK